MKTLTERKREQLKTARGDYEQADADMKKAIFEFDINKARQALSARDIAERKVKRLEAWLDTKGTPVREVVSYEDEDTRPRCEADIMSGGGVCQSLLYRNGECPNEHNHA